MRRLLALAAALLTTGCGPSEPRRTPVVVYAAASLTDAFRALERDFEARHPSLDVQLAFAGSQVLRLQIEQGAPADVFASANLAHAAALERAQLAAPSQTFATNELALIVPAKVAPQIERFDALPAARRLVVGAPSVPVGRYTQQLFDRAERALGAPFVAALRQHVVSEETNVRLVRTKVALGEADAAFVYRTDAVGARGVVSIPIPPALNVRARYPIAWLLQAPHPEAARTFVQYVLGPAGQATLVRHGFVGAGS